MLEGIALVGNPNFAIIDEAYPYIARRLMTDNSPRLKAALRYMVYGNSGVFDAARLIDLLQALEKFKAVRDEGDGTAYKIDGVRGAKYVGKAGDVRGSQVVNVSERDTYIGEEWFANSTSTRVNDRALSQGLDQTRRDETTVRDSLRFFFSPEGHVLREFMLEELVTVVDASNREASRDFVRSLGLNNYPLPSLFTTFIPKLTGEDKMASALC